MELIGYNDSGVFLSNCEIFVLRYIDSQWRSTAKEEEIFEKASMVGFDRDSIKQALLGLEQCHLVKEEEYYNDDSEWAFITCE